MKQIAFPNSGMTTALGFGCAYLTGGWELKRSLRLLDAAYDAGYRHFDTAPLYGIGTSEEVVGKALKQRRSQVTLATKVGIARPFLSAKTRLVRLLSTPVRRLGANYLRSREQKRVSPPVARVRNLSPTEVLQSLSDSLTHLQTDYVDCFMLHEVLRDEINDDLVACLEAIRKTGKAKAIGVSASYEELTEICNTYPGFFDLCQYSWDALLAYPPSPSLPPFHITHRTVMLSFQRLTTWRNEHPSAAKEISQKLEIDLGDDQALANLLIGAAIAANPNGITLVASRRASRIRTNAAPLREPEWQESGKALLSMLCSEQPGLL